MVWFLVAPLAITAIVAFGASIVALNAYLPSLARTARDVREKAALVEQISQGGLVTEDIDQLHSNGEAIEEIDPALSEALEV